MSELGQGGFRSIPTGWLVLGVGAVVVAALLLRTGGDEVRENKEKEQEAAGAKKAAETASLARPMERAQLGSPPAGSERTLATSWRDGTLHFQLTFLADSRDLVFCFLWEGLRFTDARCRIVDTGGKPTRLRIDGSVPCSREIYEAVQASPWLGLSDAPNERGAS